MTLRTHDAHERWASTYDTDPNPRILLEQPNVPAHVGAGPGMKILDRRNQVILFRALKPAES